MTNNNSSETDCLWKLWEKSETKKIMITIYQASDTFNQISPVLDISNNNQLELYGWMQVKKSKINIFSISKAQTQIYYAHLNQTYTHKSSFNTINELHPLIIDHIIFTTSSHTNKMFQ